MDAEQGTGLIWGVVMLMVLVSSLAARRLPIGQVLRYAAMWTVIGVGLYSVVLFRDELRTLWDRARADLTGSAMPRVEGESTIVERSEDGHFWIAGTARGRPVRFLIDSGATTTVVSAETARQLGISIDRNSQPLVVMTANGMINVWPAQLTDVELGSVRMSELNIVVTDVPGAPNLLGMNWLSRLSGWQVTGRRMILEP